MVEKKLIMPKSLLLFLKIIRIIYNASESVRKEDRNI